ncbi:MAG: class I SAM-dependent methyltransferase [Nitrospinota bacterium]|nr:class I SAM-dependent methyltransferase [Nitrospinota bacterium]
MYVIPGHLKNSSEPWAVALAGMYREKASYPAPLSPAQGDLLRTFIANIAPSTVLEIGCYIGISSLWIAAGLEQAGGDGILHGVDRFNTIKPWLPHFSEPVEDPKGLAESYIRKAGLSHRVKFHKGDSCVNGKEVAASLDGLDILFIDGDHTEEGCANDFNALSPFVKNGGYIILHDIYPEHCGWDGPRKLIDGRLKNDPGYELLEIHTSPADYGIALIRKLG